MNLSIVLNRSESDLCRGINSFAIERILHRISFSVNLHWMRKNLWTQPWTLFFPDKTMRPKLILTFLQHPRGYYRTNITVGRPPLPGGWDAKDGATLPGPHCLKHHAALYKDGVMVGTSCLQIWPTWMYDLRYRDLIRSFDIATTS